MKTHIEIPHNGVKLEKTARNGQWMYWGPVLPKEKWKYEWGPEQLLYSSAEAALEAWAARAKGPAANRPVVIKDALRRRHKLKPPEA